MYRQIKKLRPLVVARFTKTNLQSILKEDAYTVFDGSSPF